jgi:quinolinate synthase
MEDTRKLNELIRELKAERDALIYAHNYQRREVQEIADYVGDFIGLAREAMKVAADVLVLCGNRFMAQTAKVLSPQKLVLVTRRESGCPMADTVTVQEVARLRAQYPRATFVCDVNVDVRVKAECDVCCTAANAVQVVNRLDNEEIVIIPDKNLASWVSRYTTKRVIQGSGFCFVHERIDAQSISRVRELHPDASIIVHPGCRPEVVELADEVMSTSEMVEFSKASDAQKIVVGSEEGLVHRLSRENPDKTFYTAGTARMCKNMKLTTLEDIYIALKEKKHRIELEEETRMRVRTALERMFRLCGEAI